MSLINQVLRDLDRRHAVAGPAPAAVKTSQPTPPNRLRRAWRWALGVALTAAAVLAGGVAQGSLHWPARWGGEAAPVPVPVPVTATALSSSPVHYAPRPVEAPVAPTVPIAIVPAASAMPEPRVDPALSTPPTVQALAAPTARPAITAAPGKARAPHAAASSATRLEARIDKHSSSRTPQERAEANYQRGVSAHQAGQIDDSALAFMAALREDPSFAPARQAQAGLLISQSRPDEAQALLREGLVLAPQQPTLALMLARLQAERQDLATAADTLKTALPQATRNAEYLGFYAAILQRANRHTEAAEQFGAALRLAPGNSVWWMGLGISLAAADQLGPAREAFTRAKTIGALPAEAGQYVELRLRQLL